MNWEHFERAEFDCHDGTQVPPELLGNLNRLVTGVLDPLREAWRGPLVVVSGYRTRQWNARVGGAARSAHETAEAADIAPVSLGQVPALLRLVKEMHAAGSLPLLGGLGTYARWIHVDVRMPVDGHLRRWTGAGMGSEPG